ncbi:MAG: SAM-dependent methyltransferase [Spirochaetae bacterium HGW-Spirochaetae-10]|nr:MAG: SAM-dependent methyltransferase [Spirochaetae bacterium HGW-Spirochaetae-10]
MNQDELREVFDRQASSYDAQWARMSAMSGALHFLLESVFADLPTEAQILCVGAGTGEELLALSRISPRWRFTVVEPSGAMLQVCRKRADEAGLTSRCTFHEGYVDSLPAVQVYNAATCFLVSQFILETEARTSFFKEIALRLLPSGILASSDLSSDPDHFDALLALWQRVMSPGDRSPESIARMKTAYAKDVAILTPQALATLIESAGFKRPVPFFQAGLIHAWYARRM